MPRTLAGDAPASPRRAATTGRGLSATGVRGTSAIPRLAACARWPFVGFGAEGCRNPTHIQPQLSRSIRRSISFVSLPLACLHQSVQTLRHGGAATAHRAEARAAWPATPPRASRGSGPAIAVRVRPWFSTQTLVVVFFFFPCPEGGLILLITSLLMSLYYGLCKLISHDFVDCRPRNQPFFFNKR